ncbi:Short-chain dehydrogenase srdC [Paramyrothecium foliicola]|nr:Short-chain dehydrogenase srdC [Paramyrothecium foliicola]
MHVTGNVFITGGGNGIGRACALIFAEAGALTIVVSDLSLQAAQKVAEEIPSFASNPEIRVDAIKLDVTVEVDVVDAITRVKKEYGRIDYCVHSAGVAPLTLNPVSSVDVSDFKNVIDINLTGTLLVTSAAAAAMKSQELIPYDNSRLERGSTRGAIVNLSSLASVLTLPSMIAYNASKHGVAAITKTAAIDSIGDGIRVNCVSPAWTATPMVDQANKMFPEEIADTVLFLCSPKASYITGSNIIVDGGYQASYHDGIISTSKASRCLIKTQHSLDTV